MLTDDRIAVPPGYMKMHAVGRLTEEKKRGSRRLRQISTALGEKEPLSLSQPCERLSYFLSNRPSKTR